MKAGLFYPAHKERKPELNSAASTGYDLSVVWNIGACLHWEWWYSSFWSEVCLHILLKLIADGYKRTLYHWNTLW